MFIGTSVRTQQDSCEGKLLQLHPLCMPGSAVSAWRHVPQGALACRGTATHNTEIAVCTCSHWPPGCQAADVHAEPAEA
jgi:hypothetical protein